MRRWQFFTPESLNDMTQDGLEQIFGQYIQTMEAFRPINLDDDDDDDELWADEEVLTPSDNQLELTDMSLSSTSTKRPTTTKNSSTSSSSTENNQRRKSLANMRNRLSWTSDTGLSANSAVAQTWANELMTMFNMEFQVDTSLTLSTAPKLPELPFSSRHNQHKRRSRKSQRYSTDSFMNLIPAFETFNLEELDRQLPIDTLQQQSKPGPIRSSSLKCKSQFKSQDSSPSAKNKSTDILNGLVSALSGVKGEKALSKKKSIRRLAALVTGNTNNSKNNSHLSVAGNTSRLSIASTSTLSSTNSVTMIATKTPLFQQHKPLPETPPIINEENITKRRTSYTMARPVVVEQLLTCMTHDDPSSSSTYLSTVTPKRSKSAFMKLSTGLGKGQKKASSRKNSTSSYSTIEETNTTEANFVKRMASLGKRMKLQRV
ncbi:uncharacterized protein BX664DRAFT_259229 [Halteromyces radiatus]|uniref:uncharacterized protein n=1 Tax=Halteromyces radiatus TaxID=101107 RepID=UPI0022204E11|nr:uncharacterized protein BX664DRAFT_259229 [Halteromyces radiatus]KAI8097007.1 hypothetical protein BX664DRAFT_259229 [Halteromyces radiatus]